MLKNKISFFFTILFLLYGPQNLFAQAQENPASLDQTKLDKKTESSYQLTADKIDPSRFNNVAVIQGLNKIIAKTSLLEIKIGDTIKFGKLNITVHKCWQSPLEQKPESKILLEIYDTASSSEDDQSTRKRIFYGWMLSSSPSISGIEHPIYDITAIGCKNR